MKRRAWLRWGCAHCALLAGGARAQGDSGWQPPDRFTRPEVATEEGGLWAIMDREEQRLRRSPFRLRDEWLGAYLTDLACRLGGTHCPDIRVYAVRAPYFNASMAPNGMMQVWSGLLLRVDNEAQLAAVIGHEIGHYLQRHTLQRLRDMKEKAALAQFLGLFGLVGAVGALATLASALAFSRDQEREADRIGISLMKRSGHDPREAATIWANLLEELRATPGADPAKDSIMFATHPSSEERRSTLESLAAGADGQRGEEAWRQRIAPLRRGLLDDELKRGRPWETVALTTRLIAREPGHPDLLYARGEAYRQRASDGDDALALADLEAAATTGKAPPQVHRSLAELHRVAGREDAARDALRRYLEAAPDAPDAAMIRLTLESKK